ncbi:MAG TPA: hypothetical protein VEC16_03595 [Alphaproteobacteria bacterium]|nr:hypothetical protein [Alphaproteobacteria bacterium]
MEEYAVEGKEIVNISKLTSPQMDKEHYIAAHKGTVIVCHDIFIKYNDPKTGDAGVLLVVRKNVPAKDLLWPIGGRIQRGVKTTESLKHKVKEECSLEITHIKEIGLTRTYFETEPFGHGKGTDTINIVYFAEGNGEIKLNNLHAQPTIITKDNFSEYKNEMHPYIREYVEKCLKLI